MADRDLSATDIFMFDVKAAKLAYLLNKRKLQQPVPVQVVVDVPAKVRQMFADAPYNPFDETLPMFLRRQAD